MTFLPAQYDDALDYPAQQDRLLLGALFQAGVFGASDLQASAATGFNSQIPSGTASISNTFQANMGNYLVTNIGAVTVQHQTPNATDSRLDTLFVKVFDSRDGGDASDVVNPIVVEGTPQTGNPNAATLRASRAGVGAVPSNALLVADVYVPAAAASAAAFTYFDRRPWARGANSVQQGLDGGSGDYSTATTWAPIDTNLLQARVECSGAAIDIDFDFWFAVGTSSGGQVAIYMDGSPITPSYTYPTVSTSPTAFVSYPARPIKVRLLSPTPGSHLFAPWYQLDGGTAFYIGGNTADGPATFSVREFKLKSGNNGNS